MEKSKSRKLFYERKQDVIFAYAFLLLLVVFASCCDKQFLIPYNLGNLVVTALPYVLITFGQTLVILTFGIDLSLGDILSLSNVIFAYLMANNTSLGVTLIFLISLAAGTACGFLNGWLIAKTKIQPIIITLGTSSVFGGLSLYVLAKPGGSCDSGFASFCSLKFGVIPIALIFMFVISVIVWLALNRTRFGTSVFAIGGNETSAYSSGVNIGKTKILVYTIAGALSALSGIFLASQMYSGDPTIGSNYTMKSIIMVAIGGTSLMGGKGGILGGIAGAFILVIINNFLNLAGISTYYQFIIQGLILIASLLLGAIRGNKKGYVI